MSLSSEKIFKIVESSVIDNSILSVELRTFYGDPYDNGSFVHNHKDIYDCVFEYEDYRYVFEVSKDYYNNYNFSLRGVQTSESFSEFNERLLKVFTLYQRNNNINNILND